MLGFSCSTHVFMFMEGARFPALKDEGCPLVHKADAAGKTSPTHCSLQEALPRVCERESFISMAIKSLVSWLKLPSVWSLGASCDGLVQWELDLGHWLALFRMPRNHRG